MTVEELIQELGNMDPEAEVKFTYDYGDHWHNQVAKEISTVEEGDVVYSEYHRMDKVVDDDSIIGDDEHEDVRTIVLLSNSSF